MECYGSRRSAGTTMKLLDPLFTTERMREIFSDQTHVQRMLDFEAALSRALEKTGVAPKKSAAAVARQCHSNLYSAKELATAAAQAGNLAIPLVKQLTAHVAKSSKVAAGFVHLGATSQDVIDTATVLQLREAMGDTEASLLRLSKQLEKLAATHRETVLAGRTWMQQAAPITLGLKFSGWLDALKRHRERLAETRKRVEVLQFGGAVGTLAALGPKAPRVAAALAGELKLALPEISWHTQRDRFAEVAATYGLLVGSLGKIARDTSLMAQTEIAELAEPSAPGRGGSSTLPQKQNPVGCSVILSAAIRVPALVSTMLSAMVQEHERGLGGWQAEWETLPEICMLAAGALAHLEQILTGLEVDEKALAHNLRAANGLLMAESVSSALAKKLGKMEAHHLVERAAHQAINSAKSFRDVLFDDREISKYLSRADIEKLLQPENYTGQAQAIVGRVVSASKRTTSNKRKKR
jgi:3-carboxy-cis,cis-muconate cycloisomerase